MVEINNTFAQYICRAGYKLESGDQQRSCDVNGTWSGIQLVCTVDSVLPKAYLVILIVGATIAVFLACIPYDFYRFRKRKKKVRDHQERLSLVTRIAPGHAKVVLETVPVGENLTELPQARRFGLKSLFSVFRFVGGKMKSPQGNADATIPMCSDEKNGDSENSQQPSVSAVVSETDGATALPDTFSPRPASSCLPADDVIDYCPLVQEENPTKDHDKLDNKMTEEDDEIRPRSSSPLVFHNNDIHNSEFPTKKGFNMFKKANDILTRESQRHAIKAGNRRSVPSTGDCLLSEPATVEVTYMNEALSTGAENPRGNAQEEFPNSKVSSSSSSTSSPDVTSLRKGDPKVELFRTFHYPSGKSSVAYHSMPTIADIP